MNPATTDQRQPAPTADIETQLHRLEAENTRLDHQLQAVLPLQTDKLLEHGAALGARYSQAQRDQATRRLDQALAAFRPIQAIDLEALRRPSLQQLAGHLRGRRLVRA